MLDCNSTSRGLRFIAQLASHQSPRPPFEPQFSKMASKSPSGDEPSPASNPNAFPNMSPNPPAIHNPSAHPSRPTTLRSSVASTNASNTTTSPPATGKTAPPTKGWKLQMVVWLMVANTGFQAALSYFMWGYGRIDRPGWATGTWIGAGCGVAALSGGLVWWEGRGVKRVEGLEVKVLEVEEAVEEEKLERLEDGLAEKEKEKERGVEEIV